MSLNNGQEAKGREMIRIAEKYNNMVILYLDVLSTKIRTWMANADYIE